MGSSYSWGGDAVEDVLLAGGRGGGGAPIAATGFDLNMAAAAATLPTDGVAAVLEGCY